MEPSCHHCGKNTDTGARETLQAQGNWKYSHSDLPDGPVLPKNVVHLLGRDFVRQVPDVQDPVDLRREPDLMEEGQAVC